MGKIAYTEEEIEFLKQNHKNMSREELSKKLNRGIKAIGYKLWDLKLRKIHLWTDEEIEFLETNYDMLSGEELAEILDQKIQNVYAKASSLGLGKQYVPLEREEAFGRLTVIKRDIEKPRNYICKCSCGNTASVRGDSLRKGLTASCGCLGISNLKKGIRKDPGVSSWARLYGRCRSGAKVRNLDFKLSTCEYKDVSSNPCDYCGDLPRPYNAYIRADGTLQPRTIKDKIAEDHIEKSWINANGIDRVDSSKGYCVDNCVPCCPRCNGIKMDMSKEEFLNQIKKIYIKHFGDENEKN